MPMTEKEYNGNLFDQLALLEDIEEVAKATGAEAVLDLIARKKGADRAETLSAFAVDKMTDASSVQGSVRS